MPVDFLTPEQEQRYGRYTDDPTPDQLAQFFYFDTEDLARIRQRRDQHTGLGFALQLATVRFLGTFLDDPIAVPPNVLAFVAHQLGVALPIDLDRYRQGTVRWEHTAEITAAYGYRAYTAQPGHFQLLRWLFARAWIGSERPSLLFDRAIAWLRSQKVVLPGVSSLERDVARVRDRANERVWRRLAQVATPTHAQALLALLDISENERVSPLDQLRRIPTVPSSRGLLDALERLTAVRALGVGALPLHHIPFNRLQQLARFAATARAQAIERMPRPRRLATLLAFVRVLEMTAHDTVLDLFDGLFADLLAEAFKAGTAVRLRTLHDLDAAALQLANALTVALDPTVDDAAVRSTLVERFGAEALTTAITQVQTLAKPPEDTTYAELRTRYRRISRMRPALLATLQIEALPSAQAVVEGYRFLQRIEDQKHPPMPTAPMAVVTRAWKRYVVTANGSLDRMAYTYCVFDRLKDALRRREVFVTPSVRYADPRLGMLAGEEWTKARPQVCRALGQPADGTVAIAQLTTALDTAYRTTATGLPANTAVNITTTNDEPTLTLSPLDRLEEPASLLALRSAVEALVPQADLPEVLLEIQRRTGFCSEFAHLSKASARVPDLAISVCAVLLAEACNIGFTPLINPAVPALTRDRLSWVQQNYVRAETIGRANARLVEAQSRTSLAQHWGGGEVASADGMRFVVPLRTIHADFNAKYFARERGVTLYNLVSDQYSGLHGIVVTGTLRDSLVLLSLLLGQQTLLHPTEIMTDTGAYADVIFGLLWLLGYQFSPRISDVGSTRFWRIDREADYGALNGLASHRINTHLIETHWDELLRLAGSLTLGVFQVESLRNVSIAFGQSDGRIMLWCVYFLHGSHLRLRVADRRGGVKGPLRV